MSFELGRQQRTCRQPDADLNDHSVWAVLMLLVRPALRNGGLRITSACQGDPSAYLSKCDNPITRIKAPGLGSQSESWKPRVSSLWGMGFAVGVQPQLGSDQTRELIPIPLKRGLQIARTPPPQVAPCRHGVHPPDCLGMRNTETHLPIACEPRSAPAAWVSKPGCQ